MQIQTYKQIPNYLNYYINEAGNSVIKLCRQDLYKAINGEPYRRKTIKTKYFKINDGKYLVIDNLVFKKMKIHDNKIGYKFVKLTNEKDSKNLYLHRLMYQTFVGVIPSDKEVNHIDHNKENNTINNLELLTRSENIMKSIEHYGGVLLKRCKQCSKKLKGYMEERQYCNTCKPIEINPKTGKRYQSKAQIEHYISTRKVKIRPTCDELWELIKTIPFTQIGKLYDVSDNAIRGWCKEYGLPYRKRDID